MFNTVSEIYFNYKRLQGKKNTATCNNFHLGALHNCDNYCTLCCWILNFYIVLHVIFSGAEYKFPWEWNAVARDKRSEGYPLHCAWKNRECGSQELLIIWGSGEKNTTLYWSYTFFCLQWLDLDDKGIESGADCSHWVMAENKKAGELLSKGIKYQDKSIKCM